MGLFSDDTGTEADCLDDGGNYVDDFNDDGDCDDEEGNLSDRAKFAYQRRRKRYGYARLKGGQVIAVDEDKHKNWYTTYFDKYCDRRDKRVMKFVLTLQNCDVMCNVYCGNEKNMDTALEFEVLELRLPPESTVLLKKYGFKADQRASGIPMQECRNVAFITQEKVSMFDIELFFKSFVKAYKLVPHPKTVSRVVGLECALLQNQLYWFLAFNREPEHKIKVNLRRHQFYWDNNEKAWYAPKGNGTSQMDYIVQYLKERKVKVVSRLG